MHTTHKHTYTHNRHAHKLSHSSSQRGATYWKGLADSTLSSARFPHHFSQRLPASGGRSIWYCGLRPAERSRGVSLSLNIAVVVAVSHMPAAHPPQTHTQTYTIPPPASKLAQTRTLIRHRLMGGGGTFAISDAAAGMRCHLNRDHPKPSLSNIYGRVRGGVRAARDAQQSQQSQPGQSLGSTETAAG